MTALTTAVAAPRFKVRGLRGAAVSATSLVAGALVWQLIGNHTKQASFVSFTATVRALYHLARSGVLFDALWASLQIFGAGLAIATAIGFLGGLVLARLRILRIALDPYFAALYATPMVALIPYILIIFGFGFGAKVIVVTLFAVWPILINTLEGARSVSEELLEVARSSRSSEPKLWRHVIVPYTLPFAMTGLRQGLARALVGMIVAEFFLSASGLGELIIINTQRFETANVLAAVLVMTLLATLLMGIGRAVENYFARWKVGA